MSASVVGVSAKLRIPYFDRVPDGWFVLDVMKESRKWDWVALIADTDLDDLKNCTCDFPALFFVHPKDYRPGPRKVRQGYVRIPGKHRNWDAACDALKDMMATRH